MDRSKVTEFQNAVIRNENILRLDVQVDEIPVVEVLQRLRARRRPSYSNQWYKERSS
jgi:hypothetical protein